jgi:hypothetical protein
MFTVARLAGLSLLGAAGVIAPNAAAAAGGRVHYDHAHVAATRDALSTADFAWASR